MFATLSRVSTILSFVVLAGCVPTEPVQEQPQGTQSGDSTDSTDETAVADTTSATLSQATSTTNSTTGSSDIPCGDQTCADNEFCKLPEGACEEELSEGTCTPIPEGCDANYEPVCGCDGVTHGNACSADASGVSVELVGECVAPPTQGCAGFTTRDECEAEPGCWSKFLSSILPTEGDPDTLCITGVMSFAGCFEGDIACGDAETIVCKDGTPWWSSDTCFPTGYQPCEEALFPGNCE